MQTSLAGVFATKLSVIDSQRVFQPSAASSSSTREVHDYVLQDISHLPRPIHPSRGISSLALPCKLPSELETTRTTSTTTTHLDGYLSGSNTTNEHCRDRLKRCGGMEGKGRVVDEVNK